MDLSPIVAAFPVVAPYLAALPLIQVTAGLLAQIPRLAGVTHETIWSRIWRTVASLPVLYRPSVAVPAGTLKVAPPQLTTCVKCGYTMPRGFAAVRTLAFLAGLTLIVVTGVRCAAVRRGVETVEGAPIKAACFTFDPPVKDSTGTKVCSQLCVSTDPPSAVWACQEVKP